MHIQIYIYIYTGADQIGDVGGEPRETSRLWNLYNIS